jgi:hypothetical protein
LRWFWPFEPRAVQAWFTKGSNGVPAGGGGNRTDNYCLLDDPSIGAKERGRQKGLELKWRLATEPSRLFDVPCRLETWAKLPTTLAPGDGAYIPVIKQRWLRKFETATSEVVEIPLSISELPIASNAPLPVEGCNVEFTKVELPNGEHYWTLGLEAFGDDTSSLSINLRRAAEYLARPPARWHEGADEMSYPEWLLRIARNDGMTEFR